MKKKYVKDYVPDGKGEYRYQGKYYQSRISEEQRKKEGKIQILYGICCLILILIALCIPCNGNKTIYIVIPLEITLVCLWGYLTGGFALLKAQERMEQKDYDKAYQSPIQSLTIAIFLYVFSLGGQLIGILMSETKRSSGDVYFAMILGLILVISCVVWNRQRKIMHYVAEEKVIQK